MSLIVATPATALSICQALQKSASVRYQFGVDLVDLNGVKRDAVVSPIADNDSPAVVSRSCMDTTAGSFTFQLDQPLAWGADIVAPYLLVTPVGGDTFRFAEGAYVATSPTTSLDKGVFDVTCYDKIYLLKSDVGDSFSANDGTYYSDAVGRLLTMAGIPNAQTGSRLNPATVNYPNDWYNKKIPTGSNNIFLADDSNNFQYIDIINALLKASGCQQLYTDPYGKFSIDAIVDPRTQQPRWNFSRTPVAPFAADFATTPVITGTASYESDVWGMPNQFVFVQTGLTFDPMASGTPAQQADGSQGRYVINNVPSDGKHYRPPADQASVGRIIRSVQRVDSSSQASLTQPPPANAQADLIAQAEKIYSDTFSGAEKISISTSTWPCAWQLDVFRYLDAALPRSPGRNVQTQSWNMPLNGSPMTWETNAVRDLS